MVLPFTENNNPTPYPQVNAILHELLHEVQQILGKHLLGMYLEGSLASTGFDQDSDIDFVVVTDQDVSEADYLALQIMHGRINQIDSYWAINLEGSYISQSAIRRHDPQHALHPNIERGSGERLKLVFHDETWIIHRYILRERGIILIGPAPETLIDPLSPADLQRAMFPKLHDWAAYILNHPDEIVHRGYQSYTVFSICRILYTLQFGDVVSKPAAAHWAKQTLGPKWHALIDRTWTGRHTPGLASEPQDITQTLEFIRFALEVSTHIKLPPVA
ncbi:MAG: DUF4111 domain-containing protein [Chloroflexi bacterium]|nr:DUF4111 domain-containing protein [Chloroflexota bacterium]